MSNVSRRVLEQAIVWQLELNDGDNDPAQRKAFDAWLNADPQHAEAWARFNQLEQDIARDASPLVRASLVSNKPPKSRATAKLTTSLLSLTLVAALALTALNQHRPLAGFLADHATGNGEQLQLELDDHTKLRLNSRTVVDIDFSAEERRLVLHSGEILVETAHDDKRPFVVETDQGRLQALGTRFLVREADHSTRLIVLQSAVAVEPTKAASKIIINAGEQVVISAQGLSETQAAPIAADAWSHGMLVVENQRLEDLINSLAEYRSGYLGVSSAVADLRISGSFPLRNSDLALATLLPSLPVRIEQHSKWWVRVVAAPPSVDAAQAK